METKPDNNKSQAALDSQWRGETTVLRGALRAQGGGFTCLALLQQVRLQYFLNMETEKFIGKECSYVQLRPSLELFANISPNEYLIG